MGIYTLILVGCFFGGIIYIMKAGATAIKEDNAIVDAGIQEYEASHKSK